MKSLSPKFIYYKEQSVFAVTTRAKLQRMLLSCVSPARSAPVKGPEASKGLPGRFQMPYILIVSALDELTLELDFSSTDVAGGGSFALPWTPVGTQFLCTRTIKR